MLRLPGCSASPEFPYSLTLCVFIQNFGWPAFICWVWTKHTVTPQAPHLPSFYAQRILRGQINHRTGFFQISTFKLPRIFIKTFCAFKTLLPTWRFARVGISGYEFLDKIHLLDSDSFYFVAGYSWIWISFCHSIADNFGFRYKNFENPIQRVPDWIQVSKIVSVWSWIGYNFQKSDPYDLGLDTNSKCWICIQWMWIQLFENVSVSICKIQ